MDRCWFLDSNFHTRVGGHIATFVLHPRISIATCTVCSCRSLAKAVQVARLSYASTQAELSNDLRAMEAMPLTCLAVCGRMCIAGRQVKVTDAGPAVRFEVMAQEGLRSRRFVAVTDCRQEPASAAGALANVWTCKGDSLTRLPTSQVKSMYLMT